MSNRPAKGARVDDAEYLKSEEIGGVIAKGLATLYEEKPQNPVDYLGKWLLNVAHVQRASAQQEQDKATVEKCKVDHMRYLSEEQKKQDEIDAKETAHQATIEKFNTDVRVAHDLADQLQNLTDHLKDETHATAVYIGKVITPNKPITEADDDKAHLNPDAEKVIRFCNADEAHKYIVDKSLSADQGLTFDVFKDPEAEEAPAEEEAGEPELDEEGNPVVKEKKVVEKLPVSVLVDEVVREPRIHFFKVPRLGSYLAVRLEYDTCLFEEAFEAGVADMQTVMEKRQAQADAKLKHEEDQANLAADAEANGEEFTKEEKEWETIEPQPFMTRKVQYVVCVNSLGQDRKFTEEQQLYVKRSVQRFRDQWEETERKNLSADIDKKLGAVEHDKIYKESQENLDSVEIEKRAEDLNQPKEGESPSEEQKQFGMQVCRFKVLTKTFYDPEGRAAHERQLERERIRDADKAEEEGEQSARAPKYYPASPEQFKADVCGLKDFNVIKFTRVKQTLFYLLGYTREQICERDTNNLDVKKAKELINDELFERMGNYNPVGPRESEFKAYQKMSFLKKNIAEMPVEGVEEYVLVMGKLLKWVNLAIDIRCEDVVMRRDHLEHLKMERHAAEEASKARETKYETELAAAREEFEAKVDAEMAKAEEEAAAAAEEGEGGEAPAAAKERPEFDLVSFKHTFDEANPAIEIPKEVVDDIDNDYDLPYTPPQAQAAE